MLSGVWLVWSPGSSRLLVPLVWLLFTVGVAVLRQSCLYYSVSVAFGTVADPYR